MVGPSYFNLFLLVPYVCRHYNRIQQVFVSQDPAITMPSLPSSSSSSSSGFLLHHLPSLLDVPRVFPHQAPPFASPFQPRPTQEMFPLPEVMPRELPKTLPALDPLAKKQNLAKVDQPPGSGTLMGTGRAENPWEFHGGSSSWGYPQLEMLDLYGKIPLKWMMTGGTPMTSWKPLETTNISTWVNVCESYVKGTGLDYPSQNQENWWYHGNMVDGIFNGM